MSSNSPNAAAASPRRPLLDLTGSAIALVVCAFLALSGCGGGGDGGVSSAVVEDGSAPQLTTKYVELGGYDECARAPQLGVPAELCNIALSVKNSLAYGQDSDGAAVTVDEILAFGSGDCGEYSTVLAAELTHNQIPWRRLSLYSSLGAAHAFLEVSFGGRDYVVDPTLGVVYPAGFYDLVKQQADARTYSGSIDPVFVLYGGPQMFENIVFFVAYEPYWRTETVRDISAAVNLYSGDVAAGGTEANFLRISREGWITLQRSDGYAAVEFTPYEAQFDIWMPIRSDFSFIATDEAGQPIAYTELSLAGLE